MALDLIDLPGAYSLDPISPDEELIAEILESGSPLRPDALLVVLDATSLQRSLGLLAQVQQLGIPTLAVLTFSDELARRQGSVDLTRLSQAVLQIGLAVLCTHLWVELHNGNTYGTDSWVHR